MKILAIESSCDDTAVAIVTDKKEIIAHNLLSQIQEHQFFGGVVPEIAARSHIKNIDYLIEQTMRDANLSFKDMDAIAATGGPGLIGGVIVGVMVAKSIASATNKPFIAINHLEGHALTVRLTHNVDYPYLLLLVSGGHCILMYVKSYGNYVKLGETIDDALGEAFDKVARMLDLGYPGGPAVEKKALNGDRFRFKFPRSMIGKQGCNFSFSGLKTAVNREIQNLILKTEFSEITIADICASFQQCVLEIITDRLENALKMIEGKEFNNVVISGGVASNQFIINNMTNFLNKKNINLISPPINLCTDNAAMIGWAAIEKFQLGMVDNLNFEPKARWEL